MSVLNISEVWNLNLYFASNQLQTLLWWVKQTSFEKNFWIGNHDDAIIKILKVRVYNCPFWLFDVKRIFKLVECWCVEFKLTLSQLNRYLLIFAYIVDLRRLND